MAGKLIPPTLNKRAVNKKEPEHSTFQEVRKMLVASCTLWSPFNHLRENYLFYFSSELLLWSK